MIFPHLAIGVDGGESGWGVQRVVVREGSVVRVITRRRVEGHRSRLGISSDLEALCWYGLLDTLCLANRFGGV